MFEGASDHSLQIDFISENLLEKRENYSSRKEGNPTNPLGCETAAFEVGGDSAGSSID